MSLARPYWGGVNTVIDIDNWVQLFGLIQLGIHMSGLGARLRTFMALTLRENLGKRTAL